MYIPNVGLLQEIAPALYFRLAAAYPPNVLIIAPDEID